MSMCRLRAFFVFLLLLLSVLPSFQTATAVDFVDVPADHQNRVAIEYLTQTQVLKGQGNGISFGPRLLINRAEWATILLRIEGVEIDKERYQNCFPDVQAEWYAPAVCYAVEQGWIKGYQAGEEAGRFIPTNPINLAELLVLQERYFAWPSPEGEYWYSGALIFARAANIVDASLAFDQQLSRAEAAEILFRSLVREQFGVDRYDPFLGEQALNELSTTASEDPGEQPPGPVIPVQLKSFADQPENASVPVGATYIPVLRFILESPQPVTMTELSIRKRSASYTRDLINSRLMINGRVVREGSFGANEPLVSWRGMHQEISPARPLLIEVNVDLREVPEEEYLFQSFQFEVSPDLVTLQGSGTRVEGEAVTGLAFQTSPLQVSTVTIRNPENALRVPYILSERETIGRFRIQAGERDVAIRRLRLEDAEDINRAHFSNFRLVAGSQEVGFLETAENNVLDFQVSDYVIEAGEERGFRVIADIGDAAPQDRIRLYVDEGDDLQAIELDFGFGARVENQFSRDQAWCVGVESVECGSEDLRRRCSREEREAGLRGCEDEATATEDEPTAPQSCDDRLAPVCGKINGVPQTFSNRCKAEMAGATDIHVGPCP